MTDANTQMHQRLLGLCASIVIVGLALVGTHNSKVGGLVVVGGMLGFMWMVHRYGRLGPEAAAMAPAKKRKKKR
jgi:hypothetical protein